MILKGSPNHSVSDVHSCSDSNGLAQEAGRKSGGSCAFSPFLLPQSERLSSFPSDLVSQKHFPFCCCSFFFSTPSVLCCHPTATSEIPAVPRKSTLKRRLHHPGGDLTAGAVGCSSHLSLVSHNEQHMHMALPQLANGKMSLEQWSYWSQVITELTAKARLQL